MPTFNSGHTPDHPFSTRRDWSGEHATLNRRRALCIAIAMSVNLVFALTGLGRTSLVIVGGYVAWLSVIVAIDFLRGAISAGDTHETPASCTHVRLAAAAFLVDIAFVAGLMYASGGGWWLGTVFLGIIVVVGVTSLPSRESGMVFASAVLAWLAVLWVQVSGGATPDAWFDLPSIAGRTDLFAALGALGTVGLFALWYLVRSQVVQVRRSHATWRRMVQSSPHAIFTMTGSGRVLDANEPGLRLGRLTWSEIANRHMLDYIHPDEHTLVLASFDRAIHGEVVRFEHRFRRGDGTDAWFNSTFSPIEASNGKPGVLVISQDITEEKAVAHDRARLEHTLIEARRMELMGRLVSGVAHELNNPLAAILTFTEQLLHEDTEARDPAEQHEALTIVHEQAHRARSIVRDLLQVARQRTERPRAYTSLEQVVSTATRALAPAMAERGVRCDVAADPTIPLVLADAAGLAQVVENLLQNAILASPTGSTVHVSVTRDGTDALLSVRDEGPGIPEELRAQVFEPFFTTRAQGEGTGLGLPVSLGIVEQHGGSLRVENGNTRVDTGSQSGACFEVRLPLDEEVVQTMPEEVFPARVSDPVASPPGARRLLLVDDESAIRAALSRWLGKRGWQVDAVASGEEALARLRTRDTPPYDIIICDLKMPGIGGAEVYRTLAAEQPATIGRLILSTGDVASAEVAIFLDTVTCPVLEKPFELAHLARLLESRAEGALRNQRAPSSR